MSGPLRLVLAVHDHQPIGNFDEVFAAAHEDAYLPFLEVLERFPDVAITLHTSGSLLEWLVEKRPEYVDRVRTLVARGQVEILGGPFYEPILANIPARDRIGQITAYSNFLERTFGQSVRGMWVPERVWEQTFVSNVVEAGVEYTLLDDQHFHAAGLKDHQLRGHYLTEDEGRLLKVLPIDERLRYLVPFSEPHHAIEYLGHLNAEHPGAVVAFGDDGEKFGVWPNTKEHCYEQGWLQRFFELLMENRDWLRTSTLGEAIDESKPLGTCYLPDGTYREMTEWVLEPEAQKDLVRLRKLEGESENFERLREFARGGFWRNFRARFPESNAMYARMLEISNRVDEAARRDADPMLVDRARTELYRAQCNCSYWHGSFGGLYLPHLRNAVYKHLLLADNLLETADGRPPSWVELQVDDFDLDGSPEVRLANERIIAYVDPNLGGHLYEFDVRSTAHNLLATLDRRPEAYHDIVRERAATAKADGEASEDGLRFKHPDLHLKLAYDNWPRRSLVDHFLQPGLSLEDFRAGHGRVSDFASGAYESTVRRADGKVEVRMHRRGSVSPYEIEVAKTVRLDAKHPGTLLVQYVLSNLPAGLPFHFAAELGFAGLAAGADDRYYYGSEGERLGRLESVHELHDEIRIGLVDEWLGVDVSVECDRPGGVWLFPIETISQSESGFELVHQSCRVIPHWRIEVGNEDEGRWEVRLAIDVDTSIARARQLAETAAVTAN